MDISFYCSFIDHSHKTEYLCDMSCEYEGICRCMSIVDPKVNSVDVSRLSNHIYSKMIGKDLVGKRNKKLSNLLYGGSLIDIYCINRILTKLEIWKNKNWRFIINKSYYGEDISDIKMDPSIYSKILKEIKTVLSIDDLSEKIKYVLKFEYGYLTDELKSGKFELIEINKSDIEWVNEKNFDLTSKKVLNHYRKFELPRGVVKKVDDKYQIIDGQHRIYSSPNEKIQVFKLV